jgi:hypothetical protein
MVSAGTNLTNLTTVANNSIVISAAYNASTANDVVTRIGNTTDLAINSTIARYVNVTISGSFLADGTGGTIAEFAVL